MEIFDRLFQNSGKRTTKATIEQGNGLPGDDSISKVFLPFIRTIIHKTIELWCQNFDHEKTLIMLLLEILSHNRKAI